MDAEETRILSLAQEVQGVGAYLRLRHESEGAVARWEWSTAAVYSCEPAYFELEKVKRGKLLPTPPDPCVAGARWYGLDENGRVVVERQQTEFPSQFYETFFRYEDGGVARFLFSYSDDKAWISVGWFAVGLHGVVSSRMMFARGNWLATSYRYDELGRVCGYERSGTNPPYGVIRDVKEIEYGSSGDVTRVYWVDSDGRRLISFERPQEATTFAGCRGVLLAQLKDVIVAELKLASENGVVFAAAMGLCDADWQNRMPPRVYVCSESTRRAICDRFPVEADVLWNPAEWMDGEVSLGLTPELTRLCESASQDIWQNDLQEEARLFAFELARAVQGHEPRDWLPEYFAAVVVDLDQGGFAAQVETQLDAGKINLLRLVKAL